MSERVQFVAEHRDEVITRTREKLTNRPWPLASTSQLDHGVPLFLDQLTRALEADAQGVALSEIPIAEPQAAAARRRH